MASILRFDKKELLDKLQQFSPHHRTIFATSCAGRLEAAYERYVLVTSKGDLNTFRKLLGDLWSDLAHPNLSAQEIDRLITRGEGLSLQDDDSPWVIEHDAAEDAIFAICYSLQCRREGSSDDAFYAAQVAYSALDSFVINSEGIDMGDSGNRDLVLSHPLIQAEFQRQLRDLTELAIEPVDVERFRARSEMESKIFIP